MYLLIFELVYASSWQTAPVGSNGLRTDGNLTLVVTGWNFGPGIADGPLGSGRGPLAQFVRVQSLVQVSVT